MDTYTIYHIPGKKIGCSNEPDARVEAQGYTHYEILEQHTDIYLASDRELELQRQYGYRVDRIPYYKSLESRRNSASLAGKVAGRKALESGRMKEMSSKGGKIGGKVAGRKAVENGRIYEMQRKAWEAIKTPISAYCKDTGEYVGTYTSQTECSRHIGIHNSSISLCLKGERKHAGGYTFKREVK